MRATAAAWPLEAVDPASVRRELGRVQRYLHSVGYSPKGGHSTGLYTALLHLFGVVGTPQLEALTVEVLEDVHRQAPSGSSLRRATFRLARALHGMGLLPRAILHRA